MRSSSCHCAGVRSGVNARQNSGSYDAASMQSKIIVGVRKGCAVKFGSVTDAGSMRPVPVRSASNRRNGVMKSASTPSISSPRIMNVVQSKRIVSWRQLRDGGWSLPAQQSRKQSRILHDGKHTKDFFAALKPRVVAVQLLPALVISHTCNVAERFHGSVGIQGSKITRINSEMFHAQKGLCKGHYLLLA